MMTKMLTLEQKLDAHQASIELLQASLKGVHESANVHQTSIDDLLTFQRNSMLLSLDHRITDVENAIVDFKVKEVDVSYKEGIQSNINKSNNVMKLDQPLPNVVTETSFRTNRIDTNHCHQNITNVSSNQISPGNTAKTSVDRNKANYMCSFCGKGFRFKLAFHNHVRMHTGDRPFRCRACKKSFKQQGHLTVHTQFHCLRSVSSGQRMYKCLGCGAQYALNRDLMKHHKSCAYKNKPFSLNEQLHQTDIPRKYGRLKCNKCAYRCNGIHLSL